MTFKVELIKSEHLRRLVELAQGRWGDEWLSTRQAADLRGCGLDDIQQAIMHGRLNGYHVGSLDRKRTWSWAQWFVRRSGREAATAVGLRKGARLSSGAPGRTRLIIRAYARGLAYEDLARMMRWPVKRIQYRVRLLKEQGLIEGRKPVGQVSHKPPSGRVCKVCGKPGKGHGQPCGSEECLKEMRRRNGRAQYAKAHPDFRPGFRKPRVYVKKVKPEKPPRPVLLCEICGEPAEGRSTICSSPECRAGADQAVRARGVSTDEGKERRAKWRKLTLNGRTWCGTRLLGVRRFPRALPKLLRRQDVKTTAGDGAGEIPICHR